MKSSEFIIFHILGKDVGCFDYVLHTLLNMTKYVRLLKKQTVRQTIISAFEGLYKPFLLKK